MDFIASPLGVLAILAIVMIAALTFQPQELVGQWREILKLYGTERVPTSISFGEESIELGFHNFTTVDVSLNDEVLSLIHRSKVPKGGITVASIPWDCVRYRQTKIDRQNFQLRGKEPIELWVASELGDAMQRRSLRFEAEDQL